jgi:hypothetical protein
MSLIGDVLALLTSRQVPAAVVGGVALAAHGIARATLDTDVLVVDERVFDDELWSGWESTQREVFRGEADEPLVGTVRLTRVDETVDVVVGRGAWQRAMLDRRKTVQVAGLSMPFVDRADLVLLKLLAGGPQDLLDVDSLLAGDPIALPKEIEARLPSAPAEVSDSWQRLRRPRHT